MTNSAPLQILILIISFTIKKNIMPSFNGISLYRHLKSSRGKNLNQYLPIGVWFTIALVALTHSEVEWSKYLSQVLPLEYIGSKDLLLLLRSLRNRCSFSSDTWKIIFHLIRISSHSLFLLKFYDDCYDICKD